MSLGMSADEYWERSPYLACDYAASDEYRKARVNQEAWMQGLYFYKAVCGALEGFGWALGGGKGAPPKDGYFEYPIPLTDMEKQLELERNVSKTLAWIKEGQET